MLHLGRVPFEVGMKRIKLSPRLKMIASLVPLGCSVADVGTDHGYIPVYLAQTGLYGEITASDINIGPLEHAQRSAAAYGVADQIRFVQAPGLSFPESHCSQVVIIAGMGGELIASILQDAPWTKTNHTLILQPNSKIDILNAWLMDNGYQITQAHMVKDGGKLYQILSVIGGNDTIPLMPAQLLAHPQFVRQRDPLLPEYLEQLIGKYSHALKGIQKSEHLSDAAALESLILELQNMRRETETWQQ